MLKGIDEVSDTDRIGRKTAIIVMKGRTEEGDTAITSKTRRRGYVMRSPVHRKCVSAADWTVGTCQWTLIGRSQVGSTSMITRSSRYKTGEGYKSNWVSILEALSTRVAFTLLSMNNG